MAEYKQYITQVQDNGNVMISEDVVATIVTHAVEEVEGIDGLCVRTGADIAEIFGKKNWGKDMKISIADNNDVTIDCNVTVKYGFSVVDVAKATQEQITTAVESMTGVKVAAVNVNICGIARQ